MGDYRLRDITEPVVDKIDKDIKNKTKDSKEVNDNIQDIVDLKQELVNIKIRLSKLEKK